MVSRDDEKVFRVISSSRPLEGTASVSP